MSNQLIIAERGLPAEEVLKFLDKNLLKTLCEEEKLFPEGGCEDLENPEGVTIRFQNFCGYLDRENTTLVVPKKLLHLLGLEGKDFDEQRRIFNEKFERFLWKVLEGLAELGILYSLSALGYPVEEESGQERPIYKLLVLLEFTKDFETYLGWVISNSHRELVKEEVYKPAGAASEVDTAVVFDILQNPHRWIEAKRGFLRRGEKRFAPTEVLQYEYVETTDTVENRFVKHLLEEVLEILSAAEETFGKLPGVLANLKENLSWYLNGTFLREVGLLRSIPYHSKVLQRRPGYRELFTLWRLLRRAFAPSFFSKLELAFGLKDFATLWEYYTLVKLLKVLKEKFGPFEVKVAFEIKQHRSKKTTYEVAEFVFPGGVKLHFQKNLDGYSGTKFRPDFLLEIGGQRFIFDAKFREMKENTKRDVFLNMHYYRDALGAEFAVALSVGTSEGGEFFKTSGEKLSVASLRDFVEAMGNLKGVGYVNIPLEV
jgi:predicted component of viral defense system (DUF524 family)